MSMLVITGSIIKVELSSWDLKLERTAEAPGVVRVLGRKQGGTFQFIELPGNPTDAEKFIAAYRRTVAEPIEYREVTVE